MNIKMLVRVALGAALALSVSVVSALAHLIVYSMAGVGTGTVTKGGSTSDFSDTSFDIRVDGLTQFAGPCGTGCNYVYFYAGSATANGQTHTLNVNPADIPLFLVVQKTGFQLGFFGTDPTGTYYNVDASFATQGLGGYQGTTAIGPVPIFWYKLPTLNFTDGTVVNFSHIYNATFSAAVAEPATWAMMLVGVGGLGASLRSRRKTVSAA